MNALAPIPRVRDYLEDPWEMMVYRELRRAALAGENCPTCDDLVDLIGANAVATTVGIIQRLEKTEADQGQALPADAACVRA
jgi:hypothetical protein